MDCSKIGWFAAVLGVALLSPSAALAYIGPGLGAGALAVLFGVIGTIILAIFAVLYYPIKRMIIKRRKAANRDLAEQDAAE